MNITRILLLQAFLITFTFCGLQPLFIHVVDSTTKRHILDIEYVPVGIRLEVFRSVLSYKLKQDYGIVLGSTGFVLKPQSLKDPNRTLTESLCFEEIIKDSSKPFHIGIELSNADLDKVPLTKKEFAQKIPAHLPEREELLANYPEQTYIANYPKIVRDIFNHQRLSSAPSAPQAPKTAPQSSPAQNKAPSSAPSTVQQTAEAQVQMHLQNHFTNPNTGVSMLGHLIVGDINKISRYLLANFQKDIIEDVIMLIKTDLENTPNFTLNDFINSAKVIISGLKLEERESQNSYKALIAELINKYFNGKMGHIIDADRVKMIAYLADNFGVDIIEKVIKVIEEDSRMLPFANGDEFIAKAKVIKNFMQMAARNQSARLQPTHPQAPRNSSARLQAAGTTQFEHKALQ